MRVFIIYLHFCILGLSCFQAYGQDNSTLVYYAVLTIEPSVLLNVTKALSSFILDGPPLKVKVSDMAVTTKCKVLETETLCSCLTGHVWSSEICEKKTECCGSNTECSLPKDVIPICHPKTRVTIYGSIYLSNVLYDHYMSQPDSNKFKQLSAKLISKMKPVYSTLLGFDGMKMTGFRQGVNASFELFVNNKMSTKQLREKTAAAVIVLNATFAVETEGLVDILAPSQPVALDSPVEITCTSYQVEPSVQEWTQATPKEVSQVTDGTESIVTSDGARTTKLTLRQTSEIWAGLITCTFRPELKSGVKIAHRASVALDVALLPQIDILSEPQFPRCKDDSTMVPVRVKCEIKNSTEHYTSKWIVVGNKSELVIAANFEKDLSSYDVITAVGCLPQDKTKPANMTCVFQNRKNQSRATSIQINVIFKNSLFCPEDDDWPDTKANFVAKLRCEGRSGLRLRECDSAGKWKKEESQCVNRDLFSIVERTLVINKGLGSVSQNAEKLFSRLTTATNDTERINTVSNLNTSINILSNMQNLETSFSESTLNDIVRSSSNILNVPLEDVWNSTRKAQSNASMAELYLASVERLIRQTNITRSLTSEASNVKIQTCSSVGCKSNVFNVTVSVGGHGGIVKTAGFKNLVKFLPPIQPNTDPNSIVVTTSVEGKQDLMLDQGPDVRIQFQLTSPRPRNHVMNCAAMDVQGKWSLDRCTWGGPSNEAFCKCKFSSAFATILSKNAVNLPALREITYVGLAFSIASLVSFLVIECLVWNAVVKTNSLYLRHVTLVNISVSLLVGDCSVLASTFQGHVSPYWCLVCVVLQHFFYLAQFCWMFCLSILLLYQTMFVFSDLSKGRYQGVCYFTGYGAPFLIVTSTFVSQDGGAEGSYYDAKSCWLTHHGLLKGSFYSFIIPVGIIVFFNLFSMALVIIKLLNHPKGGRGGESHSGSHAAVRILRSIVILTPVFGVTWIFGFATMALDLAEGLAATAVYYIFSVSNSFQGLFILLTACVGEKMVRDALMKRLSITQRPSSTKETSLTLQSVMED